MAEAPAAIDAARETLTRLGARPLLARLDRSVPETRSNAEAALKAAVRESGDVPVNG